VSSAATVERVQGPTFYGAAAALFESQHPEVLIAGPAGTGKTFAVLCLAHLEALRYPGARIVLARQTRASLTQSVLKTYEQDVLMHPAWARIGHEILAGGAHRRARMSYEYPNGSEVFPLSLENVDRTFSMEADMVCVFEVKEVSFESYQLLARCLRNHRTPIQRRICDTNPGHDLLWMAPRMGYFPAGRRNAREPGRRLHLLSKHKDNPRIEQSYIEELKALPPGAIRDRMWRGWWVAEEGRIFDGWKPSIHMLDADQVPALKWYFASMDFGYRNPGCFQVWGVDADDRIYEVAEIYRSGWQRDEWAQAIVELRREFPFRRVIADSEDPREIDFLNDFLGAPGGRDEPRIVEGAEKSRGVLHGLNQVRWALSLDSSGKPRMYVVRDNLRCGRDEVLARQAKPTDSTQEVGGYVFRKRQDGKPDLEEPDPACPNHGMDCWRYANVWKWRKRQHEPVVQKTYEHGTWGDVLRHSEKRRRARRRRA